MLSRINMNNKISYYCSPYIPAQSVIYKMVISQMISRGCFKEAEARIEEASIASFLSNPEASSDCSLHVQKLCSLTFNCGLALANDMKYADAIGWLQKSFEVGKKGNYVKTSTLVSSRPTIFCDKL